MSHDAMRNVYVAFLMFLAVCASCNRNLRTVNEPVGALQENADMALVRKAFDKKMELITDSGTLNSLYLNFADTIKEVFNTDRAIRHWFNTLLSPKNVQYPYHFALKAESHGMNKELYHASVLKPMAERILSHAWDTAGKIPYDSVALYMILAADGMMGLYHDLSRGRVEPSYTGSIDALPRRPCGSIRGLFQGDSIITALSRAYPEFAPYRQLQAEYERLLYFPVDQLGNQLGFKPPLKPGAELPESVARALGRKLRMHGVLPVHDSVIAKINTYDEQLAYAVTMFQFRHGLEASSVVDKTTLKLLNVTRQEMLLKLRAGLERWRWLGPVQEHSRIWVNLAENKVYAFQEDTLEVEMKVCSGKNRDTQYYNRLERSKTDKTVTAPDNLETPLMKAKVAYVVAYPTWHVPRNIMVKEMLPYLKKSPSYLPENNYKLYNWRGEELNPFSINWDAVTTKNWKYRIEQGPGPDNALGIVVIQFPNPYSIFMHDTPSKWAFGLENRHVSHGCIRMENPLAMVEFLTSLNKKDNYDELLMAMGMEPVRDEKKIKKYQEAMKDSAQSKKLKPVPNAYFRTDVQVPVYLVYFTAYIHPEGGFMYTADEYESDEKLIANLDNPKRVMKKQVAAEAKTQPVFSP